MAKAESLMWTCDRILCSNWNLPGSTAKVWASNFSNDSVTFELSIHPEYGVILVDQDADYWSEDWHSFVGVDGLPVGIQDEAEKTLSVWAEQLEIIKGWIASEHWTSKPGLAIPDIQYAALSYAYTHRTKMNPGFVTELLAEDMQVPVSTVKERLRKTRAKGFLSSPGKGLVGQGKIEKTAVQLLEKEGLLK